MAGRRAAWRPLVIGLAVSACVAVLFLLGAMSSWRSLVTDRLFRPQAPDPSILIVAIDDASLSAVGRWPWGRGVHANLIRALHDSGASVIAYDVNFPEVSEETADTALADAVRAAGNVVLPVELRISSDGNGISYEPRDTVAPIRVIADAVRALGHTNTPPESDGVVRRIPIAISDRIGQEQSSFAVRALEIAHPETDLRTIPSDSLLRVRVHFNGPPHASFQIVSAKDVLEGRIAPSVIRGKAVFVGATAPDLHDEQLVPTSVGIPMSGVEIHASFYDTLLTKRWILSPEPVAEAGAFLLIGLVVAMLVTFLRLRYGLPLVTVLAFGAPVGAILVFDRGWLFDVLYPLIVIVLVLAAVMIERRTTADRDRSHLRSAFSRYVAAPVVEALLRDPARLRLGGEKRTMTVLFSDVRGFTSLAERLSPEQLVHLMNVYLTRMTDIVFEAEGVLDKYIGDAIMAFWNAPLNQKDHALRAVATAIAMQRTLADMNERKEFGPDVQLTIGVGINTGDMIVGNVGSEMRFDYTVIGDAVNLASRVEGLTKEYGVGVLMTEATRIAAGDGILARRIDKVAVKGKKEPTILYEAIGLKRMATAQDIRLAKDFEEAFDRYVHGEFETAIAICGSILQDYPNDGPCRTIISRCHTFLAEPPADTWDGTWVMTKK